jgi:hypothetical protein
LERLTPRVEVLVVAQPVPFQYRSSPQAEPLMCGMDDEDEMYAAAVVLARVVVKKRLAPSVRSLVLIWILEVAIFVQLVPFQYKRSPRMVLLVATSRRSLR